VTSARTGGASACFNRPAFAGGTSARINFHLDQADGKLGLIPACASRYRGVCGYA
jgi:hypothetical protein